MVGAAVLAIVVLAAGALAVIDTGAADGWVRGLFQAKTHRTLSFRRLDFKLLQAHPTIVVDDLRIGSPPTIARDDLVRIGHGVFHVRFLPLLVGHVTVEDVALSGVDLRMVRLGPGRNNYSFGGSGLSAALRRVTHMTIRQAKVSYLDPERQLTLQGPVDYDSAQVGRPMHLKVTGVNHGAPYLLEANGAPLTGRGPNTPYAFDAALDDGAAKLALSGVTQKPFDFRDFDLAVRGSGPNFCDLGYLFGVAVPSTPAFRLSAHATHHDHVLRFQQIEGTVGGSIVSGDFTSDHSRPRRILTANVQARLLRAEDMAVVFGPRPSHLEARQKPGAPSPPSSDTGDKTVDADGLRRQDILFDLTAAKVTGYPILMENVRLHLQLNNGRLDIHPFQASLPPGRIEGTVGAQAAQDGLRARVDLMARDVSLTKIPPSNPVGGSFDGVAHLTTDGRSQKQLLSHLRGSAAFRLRNGALKRSQAAALAGDTIQAAWAALADKSALVALTCARGRFAVRGGVLTPSDLVIATTQGDATGRGSIDLAARGVDLILSPTVNAGRRPALSAPIHVSGDLQRPKVSLDLAHAATRSAPSVIGAVLATPFKKTDPAPAPVDCPAPF